MSIEYVDTKKLIAMLQAAHDYAAENEHRADYWTAMAAYLQAEGLTYQHVITAESVVQLTNLLDRPHIPGTDYYDGRDGSIEAEEDDEDRIAAEDQWRDYLDWERSMSTRDW